MAEFLTTTGISYYIENIIKNSKKNLYLLSPYLQLTRNFYERLFDTDKREVNIKIIYGKSELNTEQKQLMHSLKNLSLYYSKNLHAKCYANEESMVITSMNMYEYSEKTNREMGILIEQRLDKRIYDEAFQEIFSIIQSATKEDEFDNNKKKGGMVYCIRCCEQINLHVNFPLCPTCFDVWRIYENPFWEENYCHCCGTNASTTKDKPLCCSCFANYVNGAF